MKLSTQLIFSILCFWGTQAFSVSSDSCDVNWPREFLIEELHALYGKCMPPTDAQTFHRGQYVSSDQVVTVGSGLPQVQKQVLQRITDLVASPEQTLLTLNRKILDLKGNEWVLSEAVHQFSFGNHLTKQILPGETSKSKFFNLKTKIGSVPLPQAVQMQADCGGLNNCTRELRVFQMSFQTYFWETPFASPQTETIEAIFSADIPLRFIDGGEGALVPSQLLNYCRYGLTNKGRAKPQLISQCESVIDFHF